MKWKIFITSTKYNTRHQPKESKPRLVVTTKSANFRNLSRAPQNRPVYHNVFFSGGSGRRAVAKTPGDFKNASGPVGISLEKSTSGARR